MVSSTIDYTNVSSILSGIQGLLTIPAPPSPTLPLPLILAAADRPGLSAQEMGAEVIRRRADAGLPVGPLPDGSVNPAEEMEIIRFQVMIDYITTKMKGSIAILPGITLVATGMDATGLPVVVQGTTTGIGNGSLVVQ